MRMNGFGESAVVLTIVLAAAAYLARAAWKTIAVKRTAGCGSGCSKCPANAATGNSRAAGVGFVSVEELLCANGERSPNAGSGSR